MLILLSCCLPGFASLSVPMQDPLCFSAQSGLIPDPGVNAGYLSVPIRNLAGPEMFLTFVSSNSVYINFIFELIILISLLF